MQRGESGAVSEARNIAKFMGLADWARLDDLGLVERIAKGFPVKTATVVIERLDPEGKFVRASDIIPKSTLHRRKHALTKDESEKVWALSRVFYEVLRIYHDDAGRAARFMNQEHPMLGGRSPFDLATRSIAGADLVLKLLAKADAGVAA